MKCAALNLNDSLLTKTSKLDGIAESSSSGHVGDCIASGCIRRYRKPWRIVLAREFLEAPALEQELADDAQDINRKCGLAEHAARGSTAGKPFGHVAGKTAKTAEVRAKLLGLAERVREEFENLDAVERRWFANVAAAGERERLAEDPRVRDCAAADHDAVGVASAKPLERAASVHDVAASDDRDRKPACDLAEQVPVRLSG